MVYRLCVFVLFLSLMTGTAWGESLLVMTLDAQPMAYKENGAPTGMAVELAKEGLKRSGFVADIQFAPWKRVLHMVRFGEADALFYAVYSDERAQCYYYPTAPLFTVDLVALKRAGERVIIHPDYRDLEEFRLGLGRGFAYGPKVDEFIKTANFKGVEEATSNDINVEKLISRRVDLILVDRALARFFLEKEEYKGKLDYVRDEHGVIAIYDSMEAYLVFSKKTRFDADAQRFSDAMKVMKKDGTYKAITDKYQ